MQFQKISIPPPWKVNANAKGEGGGKSKSFKRNWNFQRDRGRGCKPKTLPWGEGRGGEGRGGEGRAELILSRTTLCKLNLTSK